MTPRNPRPMHWAAWIAGAIVAGIVLAGLIGLITHLLAYLIGLWPAAAVAGLLVLAVVWAMSRRAPVIDGTADMTIGELMSDDYHHEGMDR